MPKKTYIKAKLFISLLFIFSQVSISQNKNIEKIGDITQLAIPISAIATTIIIKDRKGTWQLLKSYGTTIAITHILKESIKKERPDLKGYNSFPSGHTSSAFSGASFIQRRYGWKYGVPAYALASFTGYSRVESKRHYFTDVLAGAIIGIGSTYIFTTPYNKEHFQLSFNNQNNIYELGFIYTF